LVDKKPTLLGSGWGNKLKRCRLLISDAIEPSSRQPENQQRAQNPKAEKCSNIKTFLRDRKKNIKKINLDMKAIFLLKIARVRQLHIIGSKFGLIATS
jgi:hypothetical protein